MRKHLFLAHSAAPSGAELGLLRLAKELPAEKTVVVFAEDGHLVQRYRDAGVATFVREIKVESVKRHDRSLWRKLKAFVAFVQYGWRLGAWAKENDVTLIVANSVKSLVYGSVTALYCRAPIVWSVHDRISSDYFRWTDALAIRILGRMLPKAYIVNSQSTLDTVWTGSKPTLISPPGIIPSATTSLRPTSASLRQIAMVGRLSPWKGQLLFIEAFDRVFKNTDVQALIVGDALFGEHDYANHVHELAAKSDSSRQIHFTGNVDDVAEILRECQMLVHASIIPEPFGSVVVEGLDAGCAVIATTPGGPAEVITPGHDGILVPCNDLDAMEAAMRALAEDEDLRIRVAANGVHRAKDFDVRSLAEKMTLWLDSVEIGGATALKTNSVANRVH